MLLIHCPYCKENRPEVEFRHAGEAHIQRPANLTKLSDEEFAEFLFGRDNRRGVIFERWRHIHGCGRFFNAARHSVSDAFIISYPAGSAKPQLTEEQLSAARGTGPAVSAASQGVGANRNGEGHGE